jgi:hypothetical protein
VWLGGWGLGKVRLSVLLGVRECVDLCWVRVLLQKLCLGICHINIILASSGGCMVHDRAVLQSSTATGALGCATLSLRLGHALTGQVMR